MNLSDYAPLEKNTTLRMEWDEQIERWKKKFPDANLSDELHRACEWLKTHPNTQAANYCKFCENWLRRDEDGGDGLNDAGKKLRLAITAYLFEPLTDSSGKTYLVTTAGLLEPAAVDGTAGTVWLYGTLRHATKERILYRLRAAYGERPPAEDRKEWDSQELRQAREAAQKAATTND